jgi:hypothetical protein
MASLTGAMSSRMRRFSVGVNQMISERLEHCEAEFAGFLGQQTKCAGNAGLGFDLLFDRGNFVTASARPFLKEEIASRRVEVDQMVNRNKAGVMVIAPMADVALGYTANVRRRLVAANAVDHVSGYRLDIRLVTHHSAPVALMFLELVCVTTPVIRCFLAPSDNGDAVMFDIQIVVIAVLALGAVAFGAVAIVREVKARRVDAHVMKMMKDN